MILYEVVIDDELIFRVYDDGTYEFIDLLEGVFESGVWET